MIKDIVAVLFDLDGLFADTERLHVIAYNNAFGRFGVELTEEEAYRGMGAATRDNVRRIMAAHRIPHEKLEEIIKIRYDSYYNLVKTIPLDFMDGALECIDYISKRGLKMGLVTSSIKKHALAVLENLSQNAGKGLNLFDYFDIMVFINDIKRGKPNPEIYQKALERLDIKSENCIALEDSEPGILSAKSAGLFVIAIPNRHTSNHNFKEADMILGSLREIAQKRLLEKTDEIGQEKNVQ